MVAKTIAQKILSAHAGGDVVPGEIATLKVDLAYVQDGTGPLAVRQIAEMGLTEVFSRERCVLFLDHAAPCPRKELANDHKTLREFAARTGCRLSEVGGGVCHTVAAESYVRPGDVAVGADSHTCTGGALGAFTTGMGSTDVAVAMATGETWMMIPETWTIVLTGAFADHASAKDFMLHFIGHVGADGATYKVLEFTGDGAAGLDMPGRLTIANMAVECGAKAGIFASDEKTRAFLAALGRGDDWKELSADAEADYERVLEFDLSTIEPTVACPHFVDNVRKAAQLAGEEIAVSQVFLGTCTNGRIEDFHEALRILRGRKIAPGVRMIVTPSSRRVLLAGMADGTFAALVEAGAIVTGAGCGACVGVHDGALGDGEVCVATQNRNFQGRMGNTEAFIYLASPLTAAACAVIGKITDPREIL